MRYLILACVCVVSFAVDQDPDRRRPASRPQLPPIEEPFRSRVERADLLQEFTEPTPVEGFYRLRSIVRGGRALRGRGYVWFGRRHCMLSTSIARGGGDAPFVQAGVRRYRVDGDKLTMTTLIGHDHVDEVRFEAPGLVQTRKFTIAGTVLRIWQGGMDSYMEFVRAE